MPPKAISPRQNTQNAAIRLRRRAAGGTQPTRILHYFEKKRDKDAALLNYARARRRGWKGDETRFSLRFKPRGEISLINAPLIAHCGEK